MASDINQMAIERLQHCKVKPSPQRISIMGYMIENCTHPSADEVFNALYSAMPTLSRTTVYNTLKLLALQGAVLEIDIDEKTMRYDGCIKPHAHFKCKRCGTIYDLPLTSQMPLPEQDTDDFCIEEQHIYYKGHCKKCNNNGNY